MKALYVFHRIFHYTAIVLFVLAGLVAGVGFFYGSMLIISEEYDLVTEIAPITYLLGLVLIVLVIAGVVNLVTSHVFNCVHAKLLAKQAKAKEEEEECECCCCECDKGSELDEQVDEVMKWKNLYVEGIITEREFIDKRNEILRIAK